TRKELSWFEKLTIVQRLTAIGILAGIGMLIGGMIHNQTITQINAAGDKVSEAGGLMETLDGLTGDVFVEFDGASKYLTFADKSGKVQWQTYSQRNDEAIASLIEDLPTKQLRGEAELLESAMQEFDGMFANAAKDREAMGLTKSDGATGKLRDAVHAAEKRLKKSDSPELMVSMLMLRRHEKDFMLRHNHKYYDKFSKEIKNFNHLLKGSAIAGKERIAEDMLEYQEKFNIYEEKMMDLLGIEKNIRKMYEEGLLGSLRVLDDDFSSYIDSVHEERMAVEKEQAVHYWGTLLAVLLAVGGLIVVIARSIVRPLEQVVRAMDALEEGEVRHLDIAMGGEIG
ncbi:MAG: HAMP domain-containing protein, partial [Ghiorsea sp.]